MFGERLKLARKKAGFSLRALANALGNSVSAQAIGKYERNEMMPSSGVLLALSKSLDVSLDYFMSDQVRSLEVVEFRKKSTTTVKERAMVEATVIDRVERYLAVEEILELDSANWHQPFASKALVSEAQGADIAAELRDAWNLGSDPIPNMTELLEEKGIKVLVLDLPDRVSGLTCLINRGHDRELIPVIVANRRMTLERRRLTLAHELGHRLICDSSTIDHEKASNIFAGAFLVPEEHLRREVGSHRRQISYPEIMQIKRLYRVSAAAMLMRFKQLGIISESACSYAYQTYAKGWRKQEPEPLEEGDKKGKFEEPKRFSRLCYWALSEQLISPVKAADFLQVSLQRIGQELHGSVDKNANHSQ